MENLNTNFVEDQKNIVSETSSNYIYFKNDKKSEKSALKQCLFDSFFKSMDSYFKHTKTKSIYDLKIYIKLENGFLVEKINENVLNEKACPFSFSIKDQYFFENTVKYLIEDDLHIDSSEIELSINIVG